MLLTKCKELNHHLCMTHINPKQTKGKGPHFPRHLTSHNEGINDPVSPL